MNTKKRTIKRILGCTTACSALALAGFGAMNINNSNHIVFAAYADSIPVSISNSNFNTNTSSNYPYSPNSFTAYNQGIKVDSSSVSDANINAGVINLTNEKYSKRFSLARRTSLDDYVLMIDSTKEVNGNTTMHNANYGYQTSSSFKLDANSKYAFTVDVFTSTNANIASLYLFDSNGEIFSSIKNINSYNTWSTYSFFVSTNNYESVDLKLGMYLEGAGVVLFDNISGNKLSDNSYDLTKNNANNGSFVEENKIDNIVKTFKINSNGQLVDIDDSTNMSNLTATDYEFNANSQISTVQDSDGQNLNAILVENTDKTFVQYETKKDLLTFEQNTVYKVSVNVKTKDLDGTATIGLVRTDIDENDEDYSSDHNKTIEITSSTVSSDRSVTNDYKTYSFLINSHTSQAISYKFTFGLGKNAENKASGKLFISEIEVSKIKYDTFNSASTGSGTEKINFVSAYKDSKIMLNNGDFNAFKIEDYNSPMPATPVDWSVKTGLNTQKFGVVNTKTFENDLSSLNLSNLKNPLKDSNQNILMMYNETADTLSYTSTTKNLSAKTYHKFELSVQTQNAPLKISLVTKKDDTEVELMSKVINTNSTWQDVSLFLYTGYQSMDVSLKLTLETKSYGYAYIDNTKFDYLRTTAQLEQDFNNATNSELCLKADLSKLLASNSDENFASTTLFSKENKSGVESGLITLNSSHLDEIIYDLNKIDNFNSIGGNVYGIRATDDVHYTVKSNIGFKLTTGTDVYYKINVSVYTQNISTNNIEANTDLVGASLKLSGFEDSFTSIKSEGDWSTYTFYIQAQSDITTYLEFALGNEDIQAKGDVFFGNIEFIDNVTANEFNTAKANNKVKIVKNETKSETDENTNTENNKSGITKTNWMFIIPSLLTVLAVLIAVVGLALRKIKFKKPRKKTKTAYDRNRTVSVQYYTRKATTLREQKVRELKADLEKINAERKKFEDQYKQDLTTLRTLKIKRGNPADITKLEKDMKKNQKLSANLGLTANKISNELNYAKTDAYLNNLIKKLEREQVSEPTENNQEDK